MNSHYEKCRVIIYIYIYIYIYIHPNQMITNSIGYECILAMTKCNIFTSLYIYIYI